MSLKQDIADFLENNRMLCRNVPGAEPLEKALEQMLQRLEEPLQVAVVGMVKAGKSTLMNALLGTDILFTGKLETTYNVCKFRYGSSPSLTVHFRDGSSLDAPFDHLERWSVRVSNVDNPRLQDVKYLTVFYPCEILKKIEFIDTPGLNSVYEHDARNTEEFLAVRGAGDTVYEASRADAVIYAFKRNMSRLDAQTLHSYQKAGAASSPINSIGVLTQADIGIWTVEQSFSPVDLNQEIANKLMTDPEIQKILFAIYPVCAKPVEGLAQMQDQDWACLTRLAAIGEEKLVKLMVIGDLAKDHPKLNALLGDSKQRKQLFDKLGAYGILESVRQLQMGASPDDLSGILTQKCGIEKIGDVLCSHFGNRTVLIKTQYIFNHLRSIAKTIRGQAAPGTNLWHICAKLHNNIDQLTNDMLILRELQLLQRHYNGQFSFNAEETQELLRLTGECGWTLGTRLGTDPGSSVEELEALTRKRILTWRGRANDWMREPSYCQAAEQMVHIYEHLHYHLTALCEA